MIGELRTFWRTLFPCLRHQWVQKGSYTEMGQLDGQPVIYDCTRFECQRCQSVGVSRRRVPLSTNPYAD